MRLDTLFMDDSLLAVDKPAGMLVHRGWGRDEVVLVDIVKKMLGSAVAYPLHRLDRQTSGVVLLARSAEVASVFRGAFETGDVQKTYLALVRGTPPPYGMVDHPIPRKENGPRVDAVTEFRLIATLQTEPRVVSWVAAQPKTGRLHQVRRHLKHINHPVIGDANYGKGALNRAMKERYGLQRMALHAVALAFDHPFTGVRTTILAPLPQDLTSPLWQMGLHEPGRWRAF